MTDSQLEQLSRRLHRFAQERDWEQFHSPKNLSMALIGECGELVEHFLLQLYADAEPTSRLTVPVTRMMPWGWAI